MTQPSGARRRRRRWPWVLLLVALGGVAAVWASTRRRTQPPALSVVPPPPPARRPEPSTQVSPTPPPPKPAPRSGSAPALDGGASPGPEFVIKGNEHSMIYHTPDSASYERTVADLWFRSETDAEASGYRPPRTRGRAES